MASLRIRVPGLGEGRTRRRDDRLRCRAEDRFDHRCSPDPELLGHFLGENGYGWLPYKYVEDGLAVDFWSLFRSEYVYTGKFK